MPDEKSVSHSSPPGPQVPFLKASSISFWGQKIKLHNVEFWNFVNTQKIDFRILKLFREGSPRVSAGTEGHMSWGHQGPVWQWEIRFGREHVFH